MEDKLSVFLTNGMALLMLLMIFFNSKIHKDVSVDQKLYRLMILFTSISILAEVSAYAVEGKLFYGAELLNRFFNIILFVNNPIAACSWTVFALYKIFVSTKRIKKLLPWLVIPIVINTILGVLTFFWDILFRLDEQNVYHRTSWSWFTFVVVMAYMIFTFVMVLVNRKQILKTSFLPLLCFPAPAVIASIFQLSFYGLSLMWVGCAFSILLINFTVQNEMAKTDYLTNLPNRLQLDIYLKSRIAKDEGKCIVGMMADIDGFKRINDNFGHTVGDEALICATQLIKNSVKYGDFVARYGGDEFVFVLNDDGASAEDYIRELRNNCDEFNKTADKAYKIEISVGFITYFVTSTSNTDEFYKKLDAKMYEDKRLRKKAYRENEILI